MKFKFIAVFSIIILCFVNSFAQERNVEIEVSMEESNFSRTAKNIPVQVKITNVAKDDLKTEGLGYVNFYFSKCFVKKNCRGVASIYIAASKISSKNLKENESFDFEVNLANLAWKPLISSIDSSYPKNFNKVIPNDNIYFHSEILLRMGYKFDKQVGQRIPVNRSFRSNTITVVFD